MGQQYGTILLPQKRKCRKFARKSLKQGKKYGILGQELCSFADKINHKAYFP